MNYIKYNAESNVERIYGEKSINESSIKTLVVDDYVELWRIIALRFIEWVSLNPRGVVSLPTGKTPEFFIKWMDYYLSNWEKESLDGDLNRIGIKVKPDFSSLHFFQMDEFFPIEPDHPKSFQAFVRKYYVEGFWFDYNKCHFIDTCSNPEGESDFCDKFKNGVEEDSDLDAYRSKYLKAYEDEIMSLWGIGFFLWGIGPDGHIAFNISGSHEDTQTRLLSLNYKSMAAAAGDLWGMENVRKKMVVTIGLKTIVSNPDCVAIIIAAGDGKSRIVHDSILCKTFDEKFPASVLTKLENSRFYITESVRRNWWLSDDDKCNVDIVDENKIKGLKILHTSPHHDDMELSYYPFAERLLKDNENYFVYCTKGYTSVTDKFILKVFEKMLDMDFDDEKIFNDYEYAPSYFISFLSEPKISIDDYALTAIGMRMAYNMRHEDGVNDIKNELQNILRNIENGGKVSLEEFKSWIREFEAESVWVYNGISTDNIKHLHLPFYSDDIFPRYPEYESDVKPIVNYFMQVKPDIVTLALDPEGSGPDTHFKTLLALQMALDEYAEKCNPNVRVWGYRNVWSEFHSNDGQMSGVKVSHKDMREFMDMFNTFYQTQKTADFPSYRYDGPFCDISVATWKRQGNLIYYKDMSIKEFDEWMVPLKRVLDNQPSVRKS